jgi:hypothetical protein
MCPIVEWIYIYDISLLGVMLMRIRAMYERRIGILAFPIIIAICGITTGIVRAQISPSISEANNIKRKGGDG